MYADLVQLSSTSHTYSGTSLGAGANSIDGSFTTYQGDGTAEAEGKPVSVNYTITSAHVFSTTYTLASIRYKLLGHTRSSFDGGQTWTLKMEYTTDGSTWLTISGTETTGSAGVSSTQTETGDTTKTVSISGCKGVRAYINVTASSSDGHVDSYGYIYEIQAFPQIKKSYAGYI